MKSLLNLLVTKNGKHNYRSNFCTGHLKFFSDILPKLLKNILDVLPKIWIMFQKNHRTKLHFEKENIKIFRLR